MIKFGPYVVVKNLKSRFFKVKNTIQKCLNTKCSNYEVNINTKYCPNCGHIAVKKTLEKNVAKKPYYGEDFLKGMKLFQLESKPTIFIPNKKWMSTNLVFEKCRYNDKEFAVEIGRLDEDDILDEIKLFEKAFEKELKELRENYESVEIKFGLVNCNY